MAEKEPLGSAAEEAVHLVDTLGQWLSTHMATGESTCQVCPLCQLVNGLRERQPEVAEHLTRAGESIVAAVRAAVAAEEESWAAESPPTVQRIDIGGAE